MSRANEVLDFWKSIGPEGWFKKNEEVDKTIADRFLELLEEAANGGLADWEENPDSCLAKVILLDQFSRNMFRGNAKTFSQDALALKIAKSAVEKGFDKTSDPEINKFYYLPYMHSEALNDQEACVVLMHQDGDANSLKAALEHRMIIQRFGRFPHRNEVLGRATTYAEARFLAAGGFKG